MNNKIAKKLRGEMWEKCAMDFDLKGFEPNRLQFEIEGKINRESIKKALNWLRRWLENEWKFFSLSKYLECAPGVTIQPLSFVSADSIGIDIDLEKISNLTLKGNPVLLGCFISVIYHEMAHLLQILALLDSYLFNESVILTVADILKNPKDYGFERVRTLVRKLREIRVDNSKISFLEAYPTFFMSYILYICNVECNGFYNRITAEQIHSSFIKSLSYVHFPGLYRIMKLGKENLELKMIFEDLSYFHLFDLDGAEREARRLHKSGYTHKNLPGIYLPEKLEQINKYLKGLKNYNKNVKEIVMERIKVVRDIMKRSLTSFDAHKDCRYSIILKDGKYYVLARNPNIAEKMLTYFSDVKIVTRLMKEARNKDFDPEKVIRGSCPWRRCPQFKCSGLLECEHEKRWLDLLS